MIRCFLHFLVSEWAAAAAVAAAAAATATATATAAANANANANDGAPKITLPQLYAELSGEPSEFFHHHAALMFTVASYGDRLYDTGPAVSAECASTAEAVMRLMERLQTAQQVDERMTKAIGAAALDVAGARQPQTTHPLELVCGRVEESMSQDANLSAAFDGLKRAAGRAANGAAGRPPYLSHILDSLQQLGRTLPALMVAPELARSVAKGSFVYQMNETKAASSRYHLLAKSAAVVARGRQFGDTLQAVYEKTLDQLVPQMVADLRRGETKPFWFVPKMMRTFYGLVAENSALKRELDRAAAAVAGQRYQKSDFDFAQI